MQIVIFTLGNERYALETDIVHGIEKMMGITKVPTAPYYVKGLANLRGSIITIIDLKAFMNIEEQGQEENIIVVEIDDEKAGFIVDGVEEVVEISDDMIENVDNDNEYVKGVINFNEYIVTLLKGETLVLR
ncbi:purine-binding chemotaxis protein CheW [Caloramator sp. E03]|uniref:chemotaxis protein CheW n=1 Tax=Caloramator sp. E03 TaxID=2576307 RepID=UPI001110D7A3|nr:chemotaxis protein CheW [Caloramator sp. E03]QCX32380.1 purine-binding chemotaxis protein CheW [Caloramator sp. E03]